MSVSDLQVSSMPFKCDNSACDSTALQKSFIYRICSQECLNPLWTTLPLEIRQAVNLLATKRKEAESETEEETSKRLKAVENLLLYYATNEPDIAVRVLRLLSPQDLERLIFAGGKDLNSVLAMSTYESIFYDAVIYQNPDQDDTEADYLVTSFLGQDKYREVVKKYAYQIFRHQTRLRAYIQQLKTFVVPLPLKVTYLEGPPEIIFVPISAEIECHVLALNLTTDSLDPKRLVKVTHISLDEQIAFDTGVHLVLMRSYSGWC